MFDFIPHAFYWLVIGIFFIILEVSAFQGVGFLFAGCSAITVFLLLEMHLISAEFTADIFYFFMLTIAWGAVLWWPMKTFGAANKAKKFEHILGTTVTVCDDNLEKGEVGYVKWSGMKMKAAISPSASVLLLPVGAKVVIVEVRDNILYVKER